jgi:hypothetical protein
VTAVDAVSIGLGVLMFTVLIALIYGIGRI